MDRLTTQSTLARAHLLLRQSGQRYLPVFENHRVVGVISEEEIKRAIDSRTVGYVDSGPLVVGNYMASPIRVLDEDHQDVQDGHLLKVLFVSGRKGLL